MKSTTVKTIVITALVAVLGFSSGFGLGAKAKTITTPQLMACSGDKFVQAVGQAEVYLTMYPEKALREMLANAQMGDSDRKRYSDALDYAKEHGENAGVKAFAVCLNK